jgi:hypothetical protein
VAGTGKSFQNAVGGQMTAPLPAGFAGNQAFTATYWMRFDAAAARIGVFSFGDETTLRGIHFLIRPEDTSAQFGPWDSTPDALPSDQQNHFSLAAYAGKWVHVATAYDPAAQSLRSWINGALVASDTLFTMALGPTGGVRFGKAISASSNAEYHLQGSLDEVRIYGRPLSEAEIKLDYLTQRQDAAFAGWR